MVSSETDTVLPYRFGSAQRLGYGRNGIRAVDGWLTTADQILITSLCEIQTQAGIAGSVGEIGVHHGKLFILLYLHLHNGEYGFCVDLFDQQELNTDASGKGDETIFLNNIERFADRACLHMVKGDSLALDCQAVLAAVGHARMVSVDGGHSREATANDLEKADQLLTDDGIVLLDDYFNAAWPGVLQGADLYFRSPGRSLAPFAIGENKVYFARRHRCSFYRAKLRQDCPELHLKETSLFDFPVDIYAGYGSLAQVVSLTRHTALTALLVRGERSLAGLAHWLAGKVRR